MRVSQALMDEHNSRIIEAAATLFREQGYEKTSIADIMNAAGLTHGGFYRHFKSKQDLAAKAMQYAFALITEKLESDLKRMDGRQAVQKYIERYLSNKHADNIGSGCPLAAMGAEFQRGETLETEIATAMTNGRKSLTEVIAGALAQPQENALTDSPADMKQTIQIAHRLLAYLVGTMTLARLSFTPAQRTTFLRESRKTAITMISI